MVEQLTLNQLVPSSSLGRSTSSQSDESYQFLLPLALRDFLFASQMIKIFKLKQDVEFISKTALKKLLRLMQRRHAQFQQFCEVVYSLGV